MNEQCASAMEEKAVKAILFDMDNTLIDTRRANGVAIQKVKCWSEFDTWGAGGGSWGSRQDIPLVNQTSELLKTTLALDDNTISSICDKFKQKLYHESFDPSAGRTIDEVRAGHWEESIQEAVGSCSPPSLGAQCYYLWKNSRLEFLCLSPEICNLLRQLRSRYKLLLLTNGETQSQREKIKAVGCEEFFDAIVVGGEYAEQKPFVSIFTLCFNMLQVEAQDCIVVGDSLDTDIEGGFNAKVRATVWISSAGGAVPDGSVKPDYTIPTVLDLPDILQQLK